MEASTTSDVNARHPNADDEDFFGGDEQQQPGAEASTAAKEWAAEAAEQPQEPAQEAVATSESSEPAAEAQAAAGEAPAAAESQRRGTQTRTYRVFRELALTEAVLRQMLAELEQADDTTTPRVAYFPIDDVPARSPKDAMTIVFVGKKETLGERPTLACAPERNFVVKQPKEKPPRQPKNTVVFD